METRNTTQFSLVRISLFSLVFASGCATTKPSTQLVQARDAYEVAVRSGADKLAPEHLLTARQELDRAESMHKKEARSEAERHHAYLATRAAETAAIQADIRRSKQNLAHIEAGYQKTLKTDRAEAQSKLEDVQRSYETSQTRLDASNQALEKTRQELTEAERKTQAAIDSLKEVAAVRSEDRETVITLSGGVLFKTGDSSLLPFARVQLEKVGDALKDLDDKTIVVEGHTDSRGGGEFNRDLSLKRAESVVDFLVRAGISPDAIRAEGMGEDSPIASNENPEGRANNRRVEIVVKDTPTTTP